MKIAIITKTALNIGGVESVNNILKNIFIEQGHNVEFLTTDNCSYNSVTNLGKKIVGFPYITAKKYLQAHDKFDVIIANGEYAWGIKHPKIINLFHGSYKGYRDALKDYWSFKTYLSLTRDAFIQKIGTHNKYVVCVSEYIKNILICDGIKVDQVINNAVDFNLFRPINVVKNGKCLFVGTNNYYAKGFDVLEKLADKGIKIDCITNSSPHPKLGFYQNIPNKKMPLVYNHHEILLLPSRFESLGMVTLEAMACGLPIVMSNVGIGPELKRTIPAFVVDSFDENEYLDRINHIRTNYNKYSKLSLQYVKEYHSFKSFNKQWSELINRVADA